LGISNLVPRTRNSKLKILPIGNKNLNTFIKCLTNNNLDTII
jgi:hypothetical protein